MYDREYGYLYDRQRPVKEDAASIRRIIKTLVKGGLLPADWRYTVRYRTFAGGAAIDVAAEAPRPIFAAEPDTYDHPWAVHGETGEVVHRRDARYTAEAAAVEATLRELHAAHNHNGNDTMTDYFDTKFYGVPRIDTAAGVPAYDPAQWPVGEGVAK